jgi:hypothetical protein
MLEKPIKLNKDFDKIANIKNRTKLRQTKTINFANKT